jgi:hypothetical protein
MRQLYNSHCDGDVYPICLLLSTSVTGQYTLSQTVATTPGQLYTLSFVYNIWALNANSKGDVYFTGSETTLYPLNLATVRAYKTFSTTFTAQATTTTFNIKGSSLGAPGPNYQADYINFMGFSVLANC